MANYIMNEQAKNLFSIALSGQKIGSVMPSKSMPGLFVAVVKKHTTYGSTASIAFQEMVALLNRISLCGEDDVEKAREAIAKRNAAVRKEAADLNSLWGTPIARVRTSKVRI